jgi:hypothetical protein
MPILLAWCILPLVKRMNFREHPDIDALNCYDHPLKILWLFLVFVYDTFCLCYLKPFHVILQRNNFVQPWRIFRVKALNLELGDRLGFYFSSLFLCTMYFRKQDYIYDQDLYATIGERELIPKAVLSSIHTKWQFFWAKFAIVTDWRRAAIINIVREKVMSIKNSDGSRKYETINQYFFDRAINEAIEANDNAAENVLQQGNNPGINVNAPVDLNTAEGETILNMRARQLQRVRIRSMWDELTADVDLSTVTRFKEAMKLLKSIKQAKITFKTGNLTGNQLNYGPDSFLATDLEKDLAYLTENWLTDIWCNFLLCIAFVFNPITGVQFIGMLIKLDFTKISEVNKFNDNVKDLYPYVFVDILGLTIFLILTPINFLLGNFKSTMLLLKHYFSKNPVDERLKNLPRSEYFFGNIWRCDFFYISSIIRTIKFYFVLPFAVFSPKELKEFNQFRNAYWYDVDTYSDINRYAFRVFVALFWAKFAILRRRAPKNDKETLNQILEMCQAEIWDARCLDQWTKAKIYNPEDDQAAEEPEVVPEPAPNAENAGNNDQN